MRFLRSPSEPESISAWRAARLLAGLRLRRVANMAAQVYGLEGRRKKKKGARSAPFRRRIATGATVGALAMGGALGFVGWQTTGLWRQKLIEVGGERGPAGVLALGSVWFYLMVPAILLVNLGVSNKGLGKLERDVEWLLTLPASVGALQLAKIGERMVSNFFGWWFLLPFFLGLGLHGLPPVAAWVLAPICCALVMAVLSTAIVAAEAAAGAWMSRVTIQRTQILATVLGALGTIVAFATSAQTSMGLSGVGLNLAKLAWLPAADPVAMMLAGDTLSAEFLGRSLAFVAQAAVCSMLGLLLLDRAMARTGATGTEGVSGVRGPLIEHDPRWVGARVSAWSIATKDLTWLRRNKPLCGVAVALFAGILGAVILVNEVQYPGLLNQPGPLGAAAFGCGILVLSLTALNAFASEAGTGEILLTIPYSLGRVLIQKAALWVACSWLCVLPVLVYALFRQPSSFAFWLNAGASFVGLAIWGVIAVAVSTRGFRPLHAARPSPSLLRFYAFVVASGFYMSVFFAVSAMQMLLVVVCNAAIALAMWRDTSERLPYLFEANDSSPAFRRLTDSVVSVLGFVVVQRAAATRWASVLPEASPLLMPLAFVTAGVVVVACLLGVFAWRGVSKPWAFLGFRRGHGLRVGVRQTALFAVVAVGLSIAFQSVIARSKAFQDMLSSESSRLALLDNLAQSVPGVLIFVVAAPVFEEILFRGMVYQALRESFGILASASLSALLFAVFHPGYALVPVAGMAVCCALALQRSGSLWAAILVHCAYNASCLLLAR